MDDQPEFNFSAAEKEAGIALVASHNSLWLARALEMVASAPAMTGPFEIWRKHLLEAGLPPPRAHQAWGALGQACVRHGLLAPTGVWVRTRSRKTHAHPTQQLRTIARG